MLLSHEISDGPWEKVGTDLYTVDGQEYLDYFSNFWEFDHLHDSKVSTVIKKLKCHFAKHGIPDIVLRESGPQFALLSSFANEWGNRRQTERPVKEVECLLRKTEKAKGDL